MPRRFIPAPRMLYGALSVCLYTSLSLVLLAQVKELVRHDEWKDHTFLVMEASRDILVNLLDSETGIRGYLIAERDEYLEPYEWSRSRVAPSIARFRELTADNSAQQARSDRLDRLGGRMTSQFARIIEHARSAGFDDARRSFPSRSNKALMDLARREIAAAQVVERGLMESRKSSMDAQIGNVRAIAGWALAITATSSLGIWLASRTLGMTVSVYDRISPPPSGPGGGG